MSEAESRAGPATERLDLLRGANEIAEFIYGDAARARSIYHLAETSRLPVFRLGSQICARRSSLIAWIEMQEQKGSKNASPERTPPQPCQVGNGA